MDWLINLFTKQDTVAHIVLLYSIVIAVGVYLGKLKIGGISLGVTFVLFAGIGFLLLWWLFREMDLTEIWNVIRHGVRYDIILFSLLFGLFANVVRGLRWGLLIETFRR